MKASIELKFAALFVLNAVSLLGADLDAWQWRNPLPIGNSLSAVSFGANRFVAAGEFGMAATSLDGLNWTAVDNGSTNAVYAVTFGNNLFVGVGDGGTIVTSPDGLSWTSRESNTTNRLRACLKNADRCAIRPICGASHV